MRLKTRMISAPGKAPIRFKEGALHQQLGVAPGEKIPRATMRTAMTGGYGALAKRRAQFARNVLTGPK